MGGETSAAIAERTRWPIGSAKTDIVNLAVTLDSRRCDMERPARVSLRSTETSGT
jgi:hypothetical protein